MGWIFYVFYCCMAFNFIAIILLIFVEKAEPSVIAAWILLFAILPPVGFLCYLFFGSTLQLKFASRRYRLRDIERQYSATLGEQIKEMRSREIVFNDPAVEPYRDMVVMNARHGGAMYTQDNEVELFTNGPDKFRRMFAEMEEATESIDIIYFIIKATDKVGRQLIELLARKAAEGVKVRLCYDALGHPPNRRRDFDPIVAAGGQVYRYMPSAFTTLMQANYRMHRKIVIIDNRVAYTGGINVGDDYMGEHPKKTPWRDSAVRITGTAVWLLKLRFLSDWTFVDQQHPGSRRARAGELELNYRPRRLEPATHEPEPPPGRVGVQIVASGPDSRYQYMRDCYMKMATSARKYLYIQSPYYIPGESLQNAIIQAAASGVDVRLMLPRVPDFALLHAGSMSWARDLLRSGVRVYIYDGFLHAKAWVIDDTVSSVGTTNVNLRSFSLNYEVNAAFYDTVFATRCREAFDMDLGRCTELSIGTYSLPARTFQSLCRLGGPFM